MTDERRRFFRIDDTVGVSYRLLTEEEAKAQSDGAYHAVDVFSQIAGFDTKIENFLGQLQIKDPVAAALIDNINKKLNCVITQLELENRLVQQVVHDMQKANISACGMAFNIDTEIEADREMSLNLLLLPSNLRVSTFGRVIACEHGKNVDGYYIRIDFHDMEPADQEVLIQHIVKRQGSMLRDARNDIRQSDERI